MGNVRKLHLHVGAHKTATSHFQEVLTLNRHHYPDKVHYEPLDIVRENLKWNGGERLQEESIVYLNDLAARDLNILILSEENILGETKDIFKYRTIYGGATARLQSMRFFFEAFDEVVIWLGIRSLDEFIPSMYSEYLRHFRYKSFSKVYSGQLSQSWLSVLNSLREVFKESRINVVNFENYQQSLSSILEDMVAMQAKPDLLQGQIIRPTFPGHAIHWYRYVYWLIPRRMQSKTLEILGKLVSQTLQVKKYDPFTESQREDLNSRFVEELKTMGSIGNVRVL